MSKEKTKAPDLRSLAARTGAIKRVRLLIEFFNRTKATTVSAAEVVTYLNGSVEDLDPSKTIKV